MKELLRTQTSTLTGGASQRRCDRILRRMRRADRNGNDARFWRLSDSYNRNCE